MALGGVVYVFAGRVIPERLSVDSSELKVALEAADGCPCGTLAIQLVRSQVLGQFDASAEVTNWYTLRNSVEEYARLLLDSAGYVKAWGIDVEITSIIRVDTGERRVPGIDVPGLAMAAENVGMTVEEVIQACLARDGYFLRRALSDFREAIKSPADTGFFCFRAVESMKNCVAIRKGIDLENKKKGWEALRERLGVAEEDIRAIQKFADPVRHGNRASSTPIGDGERLRVFTTTWGILAAWIRAEGRN